MAVKNLIDTFRIDELGRKVAKIENFMQGDFILEMTAAVASKIKTALEGLDK
jgi:hypothetical protein